MRNNLLIKTLMTAALLILAIPIGASAQRIRYENPSQYDRPGQYDRMDRRQLRQAINRLDNSAARLESDLNVSRGRRVLGVFWVGSTNNAAIAQVRDFRRAVRELRNASDNGRDLRDGYDEARIVLDRGLQLDRYLRLRTASTQVDAELSELRSNLHLLAEAYDLRIAY